MRAEYQLKYDKSQPLKVYHASFFGHYLGGDAIIIANCEKHARELLKEHTYIQLPKAHKNADFTLIPTDKPLCVIVDNGDY